MGPRLDSPLSGVCGVVVHGMSIRVQNKDHWGHGSFLRANIKLPSNIVILQGHGGKSAI